MTTDLPQQAEWIERRDDQPNATESEVQKTDTLTRAGGAYIPPSKLRLMQAELAKDKNSEEFQRLNWELLKKHIHGQVNKVNVSNIVQVVRELLQKNVIRGMGLLASSILKAQTFSPTFSHVYAALVAIINSKFPNIGQLILKRLVIQFKRAFRTNNKALCVTVSRFIAHLANQRVAHEILILEILVLLMDKPTDDSIEVAITLLKECGEMLTRVIPKGLHSVFERLRSILEDADTIDTRTQQMIEIAMAVRKDKFKDYPSTIEELDLIDEEDQISHIVELSPEDGKPLDPETNLNYYKYDKDFEQNEQQYEEIRQKIIGDADDSEEEEADDAEMEHEEVKQEAPQMQKIIDMTEQDMVAFRRNVYLAIQSSLDYQEAAHKLIKFHLKPGLDNEMCHMIVDCCAQQRTYERFYGLLAERFCRLRLEFQQSFEQIARDTYGTIHRFDIKKIRIMAQLIAHLLATDAIEWSVLSEIKMNEEDTSSAGRVYVKILFQELAETMGQKELFKKLYDPTICMHFEGLLPRDHPKNTRFAINFFTLCGLGSLTVILREFYDKKMRKEAKQEAESDTSSSSSSSSDDDSSSDSSTDSSDSSSSSSDSEKEDAPKKSKQKSKEKRRSEREEVENQRPQNVEIKQEVLSDEEAQRFRRRQPSAEKSTEQQRPRRKHEFLERLIRRRESPPKRQREDPKEQVERRRNESPDNRRKNESPENRRESRRRKDDFEEKPARRQNESPDNRRRNESPDNRRRNESPDNRRERDDDRRRRQRDSSDEKIRENRRRKDDSDDERPARRQRHDSDERPARRQRHDSDDERPARRQRHDSEERPTRRQRHDSDDERPARQQRDRFDERPARRQRNDSEERPARQQRNDSGDERSSRGQRDRFDEKPVQRKRDSGDERSSRGQRDRFDERPARRRHESKSPVRQRRSPSPPSRPVERSGRRDSPEVQRRTRRDLSEERATRRLHSKSPETSKAEKRRHDSSSPDERNKRSRRANSTSSSSSADSSSSSSSSSSEESRK